MPFVGTAKPFWPCFGRRMGFSIFATSFLCHQIEQKIDSFRNVCLACIYPFFLLQPIAYKPFTPIFSLRSAHQTPLPKCVRMRGEILFDFIAPCTVRKWGSKVIEGDKSIDESSAGRCFPSCTKWIAVAACKLSRLQTLHLDFLFCFKPFFRS